MSAHPTMFARSILHVDMDAFFASVEQLDHPEWRGQPVLVGHDGRRGVVAAASYEARVFGCRSAQPTSVAKRLCPRAIIVEPNGRRYREISNLVFGIFDRYTPLVEPLSIDEAFLDITHSLPLFGTPEQIARKIKREIVAETGVTGSIGVAPNKFLAKLASDMHKPDGLTVLDETNIAKILPPLPIERMWGVGPKTAEKLQGIGVHTFGDLLKTPLDVLNRRIGIDAEHWQRLARGEDERPVTPDREAKSIGSESTFGEDLPDAEQVRSALLEHAEEVAMRLRKHHLRARAVQVKIRYGDFETITRRCTLDAPTNVTTELWHAGRDLFDAWAKDHFRPVRLIGFSGSQFDEIEQLDLFPDPRHQRQEKVDAAIDRINRKFGKGVVKRRLT